MKSTIVLAATTATVFLCLAQGPRNPSSELLREISRDYWQYTLRDNLDQRLKLGLSIEDLPDVRLEKSQADAAFSKSLLDRMAKIDPKQLTHEEWISYELLRFQNRSTLDGARYFWLRFQVTPYASPIPVANRAYTSHRFGQSNDLISYIALLNKYPGFIAAITTNLKSQQDRGIVLPKPEIELVKRFLSSYIKPPEQSLFYVNKERLADNRDGLAVAKFQRAVADIIQARINPQLKGLVDFWSGDYSLRAPDSVGLAQYPNGSEFYRYLVKFHTTLETSPEAVHQLGLTLVKGTEEKMEQIRQKLGYGGRKLEFDGFIKTDARFFASSPEQMAATLAKYTSLIAPKLGTLFLRLPRAPYGIRRLDPALEGAQTFGNYQQPSATEPKGIYYFNGSDLPHRSLLSAEVLILHELVPGHHLQLSLQSENQQLPDFRRYGSYTAYIEGWGNYASSLGEDLKLYSDPYDYYGYLAMMQFYNVRLVVDTGMNALGWTRARASQFMQEHLIESDAQVATETLRYSVDLPGQALAYRMGANKILELRQKTQQELGPKFDIRQFHDWVLASGSMPLSALEQHVDWHIRK